MMKNYVISNTRKEFKITNIVYCTKSKGHPIANATAVEVSDIVHIKSNDSKHRAQDFYLVTSVHHDSSEENIQKLYGNQFRGKKYVMKYSEIYLVQMSHNRYLIPDMPDSDNDIQLNTNISDEDVEQENTTQVPTNTVGTTTEPETLL